MQASDNALWHFACACWENPELRERLLRLQDESGVQVNMVMLACWSAQNGLPLKDHIQAVAALSEPWQSKIIQPLRALRRCADTLFSAEEVKGKLLEAELAAEKTEITRLFDYMHRLDPRDEKHSAAVIRCATTALCIDNLFVIIAHFKLDFCAEDIASICQLTVSSSYEQALSMAKKQIVGRETQ